MLAEDLVEVPSTANSTSDAASTLPRTSTFKVIAGQPMALDLTTLNHGDGSLMHTKAIYKLKGNVLTYCVGAPGQPRPTAFPTTAGDGNTLVILKRHATGR